MKEKQRLKDEERKKKIKVDNMRYREVSTSVPLYKKYEWEYIEKVELPSIRQQQQKLSEIWNKSLNSVIKSGDLNVHEHKYEKIKKRLIKELEHKRLENNMSKPKFSHSSVLQSLQEWEHLEDLLF